MSNFDPGNCFPGDPAYELEQRMERGLTRIQFFAKASRMGRYLDHTKQYSKQDIERAWWWYELGGSNAK